MLIQSITTLFCVILKTKVRFHLNISPNSSILQQLMSLIQKIKKKVQSIDMFYSSQMLRYNKDSQYQTFTGGIVSLAVVIVVVAGFFNMISQTVNRTAISSSLNIVTTSNPPAFQMITDEENKFMFAVQIQSTDVQFNYQIGGQKRYFDLFVNAYVLKYGYVQNQRKIQLESCTDAHFKMFPDVLKNKNLIMYENWFCPRLGQKIQLRGEYFSQDYSYLSIIVNKCSNDTEPDRPCYPQEQIDDLFERHGNFYFTVNYINTVVNPSEVQYRSYYLETTDYLIFSKTSGAELHYLFSDYQITTDTSIWPFQSTQIDQGLLLSSKPIERTYSVIYGDYAYVFIGKSPRSFKYTRQVQKLSAVFSYIGGLVGAISAVLFIVKIYTDMSLEIAIASDLFSPPPTKSQKIQEKSEKQQKDNTQAKSAGIADDKPVFNMIGFIKYSLYQVLKGFKFTKSWAQPRKIDCLRNEIVYHLDIKVLLQRITNMERYVSYLFDSSQLTCLKHQEKMQINEIKRLREIFAGNQKQEMDQQDQIDDSLTENPVFRVRQDAISNPNHSEIGNSNLKEQIDNMSALNLQKDIIGVKKSNNLQVPTPTNHERSNIPRKTDLNVEQLLDFHRVKEQTNESVVSRRIWKNMKNKVKQLVETQNEDKKGEVSYVNMKSRKKFRIEIIEPDQRSS